MLPLDLHVLGLSLAFILSQDQTLRCIIFFSFFPYTTCWLVTETFTRLVLLLFVYCNSFKDRLLFSFENGLQI